MGRLQSFDSRSEIPKSMRAAQGVPTAWKEEARCRDGNRPTDTPHFAFTVEPSDTGSLLLGRPAKAWIAMALIECRGCPAQYDCARFALRVGEKYGTWSMPIGDLKRLHKDARKDMIIDIAEDTGLPVQEAVRRALF
jgi:hypothetical protein